MRIFKLSYAFPGLALVILAVFNFTATYTLASDTPLFNNSLSLQGYTGFLNTPSAYVSNEGTVHLLFSDQREDIWRERSRRQENYLLSVGLFNFVEMGGRLTEVSGTEIRDLSASIKLTSAPLTRDIPFVPDVAVGMQDVGGGAAFLKSRYVVASKDFWRFRLSAGYGFGPQRMNGGFAGAEFVAHDWVSLLGEYDTKETNVGVRVQTPELWKIPVRLTATFKSSLDHSPGNIDMAVGLTFPLDFASSRPSARITNQEPSAPAASPALKPWPTSDPRPEFREQQSPIPAVLPSPAESLRSAEETRDRTVKLEQLRDQLVKTGFQNVRVGQKDKRTLVIEYENAVFNHNELDAVGVISGMAAELLKEDFDLLRLVIKKKNIRMMQISMPISGVAAFMENEHELAALKSSMNISSRCDDDKDIHFVAGDDNSSFLAVSLALWPGLSTLVGTEYGMFDYVLSLKPDLYVNLWKGGQINARWDIPLFWSDNLEDGKPYRDRRTPGRMERLMLFQGIKLLPDVMVSMGGGMIQHDIYGTMNELIWQPGNGSHRLRMAQSWGRNDKTGTNLETYLASYRYYFSPLDLSLEGTVGKFWSQDRGYMVELKRFFGDTSVSLYYKNSTASDTSQWYGISHWQAAGIQFSFPLTPQKDMKHYYRLQARGSEEWSYSQETTLASGNKDNANYTSPLPLALNPLPPTALYRSYYNRDRLNEAYITSHLMIIRDAWLKYRK